MKRVSLLLSALFLFSFSGVSAQDSAPDTLKDLNGFFPFEVPETLAAWETRAAQLRQQVLVANGLLPLPARTPLNAVVHGKVERPGFSVEKVYFESVPGFHVTGLLFRPSDSLSSGKRYPAVLSPHGHGGRLMDLGEKGVAAQIELGGERFADSGRFPKVARCANLARLGCVTLLYDMIGYADNQQLSRELGHGFRKQRPDFEGKDSWGLFSAQAEMRLQSIFGLQTWNSIRALDFLEALPDVDANRMGVTGGSGGGTQTIIIGAIDPRPTVLFPNGMVSSSMQGGCPCENASLLRIGTGNVELAALFAPGPQAMTAADDWTRQMLMPGKGFPELKQLYSAYGRPENVGCSDLLHFKHNYNIVTRELMYEWFNLHLKLGHEEPIRETDFNRLTAAEHAVYDEGDHLRPKGGDAFERRLTRWLADESDQQLAALPTEKRADVITTAWRIILGHSPAVPMIAIRGRIDGPHIIRVVADPARPQQTRVVDNKREVAAYTHGYNHSYFAQQARSVWARIAKASTYGLNVHLIAEPGTEPIALAAAVAAPPRAVKSIKLPSTAFRFADITSYRDPNFVPGAVKYGDVPGLIEVLLARGVEIE